MLAAGFGLSSSSVATGAPRPPSALAHATSYALTTNVTRYFREADGSKTTSYKDAGGNSYTDANFAQMCTDGSVAIMKYYWGPTSALNVSGYYLEPYTSTEWTALGKLSPHPSYARSDHKSYWVWNQSGMYGRSYMAYLSMVVKPSGFTYAGMDLYHYRDNGAFRYPMGGSDPDMTVTVLNTITSPYWAFALLSNSDYNSVTNMLGDALSYDLAKGLPVQLRVNSAWLPGWSGGAVGHAVTVVGWTIGDGGGTLTYIDTYGPHAGLRTMPFDNAVYGMINFQNPSSLRGSPLDGGLIW